MTSRTAIVICAVSLSLLVTACEEKSSGEMAETQADSARPKDASWEITRVLGSGHEHGDGASHHHFSTGKDKFSTNDRPTRANMYDFPDISSSHIKTQVKRVVMNDGQESAENNAEVNLAVLYQLPAFSDGKSIAASKDKAWFYFSDPFQPKNNEGGPDHILYHLEDNEPNSPDIRSGYLLLCPDVDYAQRSVQEDGSRLDEDCECLADYIANDFDGVFPCLKRTHPGAAHTHSGD